MSVDAAELPLGLRNLVDREQPPVAKCYAFLKEAILTGYMKRGQRIVEREMVELLDVSRTPLREAMRRLENENLVAHYPYKGCVVLGFSAQDIRDIYELRIVLEKFLMQKVIDGAPQEELKKLRERLLRENAAQERGEGNKDFNFHLELLSLTKNRWLQSSLGQLQEYIKRFHVLSFLHGGRRESAAGEHLAILEALLAQDRPRAEQLIAEHLQASYRAFLLIASIL